MARRAPRLLLLLALGSGLLLGAAPPALAPADARLPIPRDPERPAAWEPHWRALARRGDGFLVWESNRSGAWRIWTRRLDGSGLRRLSPEERERDHVAAHISPDGSHVVYLSVPAPHRDFHPLPDDAPAELVLLRVRDGAVRALGPARPYWQNRSAVWVDAATLHFVDGDGFPTRLDLATGTRERLTGRPDDEHGMLVNAAATHATTGKPTFSTYDETEHAIGGRRALRGCQPYFTHDGRYGFWVGGSGGPFRAMDLASRRSHVIVERGSRWLPDGHGYLYYPMVSRDGRLLAFGASRNQHGHFKADFDIFVAPLDPERFEVSGNAVRYTFDPGLDRFPDVFLAGRELGTEEGEVPLRVTLRVPPDAPGAGAGAWTYRFGDGGPERAGDASHVFETPGTYAVSARRGDVRLSGTVVVRERSLPRPLRVEVPPGRERLVVVFDEPVDASEARFTLASGAKVVGEAVPGRNRSRVLLELGAALEGSDTLHVEGVRDTASPAHVMEPASLAVTVGQWPRYDAGLLFLWETEGAENLVPDPETGIARASDLAPQGRAHLAAHGALAVDGGLFASQLSEGFARSVGEAGALSVELTVHGKGKQRRDAHVLALGPAGGPALFALVERHDRLEARVRTREGVRNVDIARIRHAGRRAEHFVVSLADGRLRAWRAGEPTADAPLALDPSLLRGRLELTLGADLDGGHDWRGTLEGVALYARGFEPEQALTHAHAYLDGVAQRDPVKRLKLRVRLAETSELPTPEEIAPYREALVLHEYEVLKGRWKGRTVRVAHWAILGGKVQPVGGAVGQKRRLVLEEWEDHPHAESTYLKDTLEPDADAPLFVDVKS